MRKVKYTPAKRLEVNSELKGTGMPPEWLKSVGSRLKWVVEPDKFRRTK